MSKKQKETFYEKDIRLKNELSDDVKEFIQNKIDEKSLTNSVQIEGKDCDYMCYGEIDLIYNEGNVEDFLDFLYDLKKDLFKEYSVIVAPDRINIDAQEKAGFWKRNFCFDSIARWRITLNLGGKKNIPYSQVPSVLKKQEKGKQLSLFYSLEGLISKKYFDELHEGACFGKIFFPEAENPKPFYWPRD